jgi:hypothetical protein
MQLIQIRAGQNLPATENKPGLVTTVSPSTVGHSLCSPPHLPDPLCNNNNSLSPVPAVPLGISMNRYPHKDWVLTGSTTAMGSGQGHLWTISRGRRSQKMRLGPGSPQLFLLLAGFLFCLVNNEPHIWFHEISWPSDTIAVSVCTDVLYDVRTTKLPSDSSQSVFLSLNYMSVLLKKKKKKKTSQAPVIRL